MLSRQRQCCGTRKNRGKHKVPGPTGEPRHAAGSALYSRCPASVAPALEPDDKRRCRGKGQLETGTEQGHGVDQQDRTGRQSDIAKRQAEPVAEPCRQHQHRHQESPYGADGQTRKHHIGEPGDDPGDGGIFMNGDAARRLRHEGGQPAQEPDNPETEQPHMQA